MDTPFPHERLDVYRVFLEFAGLSADVVSRVGRVAAVTDHLDRATESIGSNLVRGNSQWSAGLRRRHFDIAFASALECAACLDVCSAKELLQSDELTQGKVQLSRIAGMLVGLRKSSSESVGESEAVYGVPTFSHEKLDVYRMALDFVRWSDLLMEEHDLGSREARKLDRTSTAVVLNIAEGNGRFTSLDQQQFIETAHASALQCAMALDLAAARGRVSVQAIGEGKAMLRRVVSMLVAWRKRLGEKQSSS